MRGNIEAMSSALHSCVCLCVVCLVKNVERNFVCARGKKWILSNYWLMQMSELPVSAGNMHKCVAIFRIVRVCRSPHAPSQLPDFRPTKLSPRHLLILMLANVNVLLNANKMPFVRAEPNKLEQSTRAVHECGGWMTEGVEKKVKEMTPSTNELHNCNWIANATDSLRLRAECMNAHKTEKKLKSKPINRSQWLRLLASRSLRPAEVATILLATTCRRTSRTKGKPRSRWNKPKKSRNKLPWATAFLCVHGMVKEVDETLEHVILCDPEYAKWIFGQ